MKKIISNATPECVKFLHKGWLKMNFLIIILLIADVGTTDLEEQSDMNKKKNILRCDLQLCVCVYVKQVLIGHWDVVFPPDTS